MPRREAVDDEDMMARCPRCQGEGRLTEQPHDNDVDCPLCKGAGRVTRAAYFTFRQQTTN